MGQRGKEGGGRSEGWGREGSNPEGSRNLWKPVLLCLVSYAAKSANSHSPRPGCQHHPYHGCPIARLSSTCYRHTLTHLVLSPDLICCHLISHPTPPSLVNCWATCHLTADRQSSAWEPTVKLTSKKTSSEVGIPPEQLTFPGLTGSPPPSSSLSHLLLPSPG